MAHEGAKAGRVEDGGKDESIAEPGRVLAIANKKVATLYKRIIGLPARRVIARVGVTVSFMLALGAVAAEKQFRPTLETYLKRLGYEAVVLDLDRKGNKLMVKTLVNNRQRRFIVDTGCTVTALDRPVARGMKTLGESGLKLEDSLLGAVTNASFVIIEHLKLGRAEFLNQPAHVITNSSLRANQDGLLGADFLRRNFCLVDCLDRRLYVRGAAPDEKTQTALEESLRDSGFLAVELKFTRGLAMTLNARANGQPVRLLLDTGFTWSVLHDSQVKALGLAPKGSRLLLGNVLGKPPERMRLARVDSLEIGGLTLSKVEFGVTDLRTWGIAGGKSASLDVDGVLGMDHLFLNGALIDCHKKKLWLKPTAPDK